jgi:hypothetical protein
MPEFPVPIEQLIEFNGVLIVLTTRRSFEQVRYKECDVALSLYGDEILVLTAGRVPVFMGDRTRQAPPLALGKEIGGMEHIVHFLGVTILLVTAGRLEWVGYSGECHVVLSVHKDEVRVLASDIKVVRTQPDATQQ